MEVSLCLSIWFHSHDLNLTMWAISKKKYYVIFVQIEEDYGYNMWCLPFMQDFQVLQDPLVKKL